VPNVGTTCKFGVTETSKVNLQHCIPIICCGKGILLSKVCCRSFFISLMCLICGQLWQTSPA